MAEFTLTVQYITSKNCFCYLSEEFAKYAQEKNVVSALIGEKIVYFSIGGLLPAPYRNVFGINPLYAKSLQLLENNPVLVRFVPNRLPIINSVTVSPLSKSDYEVIELLANLVEETLLQQIKIVNKGQEFVIWISNYSAITVRIDDASPASVGWLDFLTEFHVNQPRFNDSDNKKSINNKNNNSDSNLFKKYKNKNVNKHNFTVYPLKRLKHEFVNNFEYPFVVFLQRKDLPNDFNVENDFIACLSDVKNSVLYVNVHIVDDNLSAANFTKTLYLNDALFKISSLRVAAKVFLRLIEEFPTVKTIKLVSNQPDDKLIRKFKIYFNKILQEQKSVVLNSNFLLQIDKNLTVRLEFEGKFCVVDSDFLENCQYTVEVSKDEVVSGDDSNQRGNYYEVVNEAVENDILLAVELNLRFDSSENVLIAGKRGTGKTALLERIEQKLSQPQYKIHTEKISCKTIKGKSGESLHRHLYPMIAKLIYYQPSVLIFDDFDVICAKTFSPEPPTPESLYYERIAEMLEGVMQNDLKDNKIMVIAAAESFDLNEKLFTSRGKHYFKNVYNTADLNKDLRKGLLQHLFKGKKLSDDVDFDGLSTKTEGFVLQDLSDLANRAIFEAYRTAQLADDFSAQSIITAEHCNTALQTVSDISLQNVNLFSAGERDFSDIGGLEDVKATLIENLVWPLQFPKLFGNAPLRLQSGLLLYGLPGTGKTILAAAAAKQCGLRLISIKGPELLSKYIGASEQAVRDVFEKAQRAKPCILFFDEFDSLAPRRGHDSTGVTDRVVNQFLTQLDGIESLSGVCVLAATSRPDLLDPALLRPGRLDKQILCPLPDRAARLDILKALSKNMNLTGDVDLGEIAEASEGFSGADLQAVVSTAQLASLEHLLHSEEKCVENVAVQQSHLVKALKETRPSLSAGERGKYERIYRNFKYGAGEQVRPGQKATLA